MQKQVAPRPPAHQPLWVVILAAGLIFGIAMGLRQVMGLYLPPMTLELGIGREPFSTAMAVANLIWGLGAVVAGMVADRYGAGRVVVSRHAGDHGGHVRHVRGPGGLDLMLSGILLGIGVSGTGITSLVGAVGRAAPPDKRTSAIATLGMAGGIGGFVAFPYTHLLMDCRLEDEPPAAAGHDGIMLPLAWPLSGKTGGGDRHGRPRRRWAAPFGRPSRIRAICCWWRAFSCAAFTSPSTACICPLRGRQGPRQQRRRHSLDHGGPWQPGRHLDCRPVRPFHREAARLEPDLFRPLLHLPRAAVPADHAADGDRAERAARACSGCPRCRSPRAWSRPSSAHAGCRCCSASSSYRTSSAPSAGCGWPALFTIPPSLTI